MIEAANAVTDNKLIMVGVFGFFLCFLGVFLPLEAITVHGQLFQTRLFQQYASLPALAVLVCMTMVQGFIYFKKKHWPSWPSLVAGIFLAGFSVVKLWTLTAGSAEMAADSFTKPGIGLFFLLTGSLLLIVLNIFQAATHKHLPKM